MSPTLSAGDLLILQRRRAKIGEIVVIKHPRYGTIVKRISRSGLLTGDSPNSTSDQDLGLYDPATRIGVAVVAITPSGLRRLSARRYDSRA